MDSTTPFQPWAANDSAKNVKIEEIGDAKQHQENVNHPKRLQTASYDKESIPCAINTPGPSSRRMSAEDTTRSFRSKDIKMDSGKIASMQQIVENTLSPECRQRVAQLLETVETLTGAEKLLLYLRLPTGVPAHDPLKQPINPLGSRAELQQTVTWIQTHLEVDPDVSLPKQDVYDEYIAHCMNSNMKPLSTADFGKVMKQVYPTVRPRRLGTRGNSRYCYAGLRKKVKLEIPHLPDLGESSKDTGLPKEAERIVCEWAETKLGVKLNSISELSHHLVSMSAQQEAPRTQHEAVRATSPTSSPVLHSLGSGDESSNRPVVKQLKRKIQGTPGRPKKNKCLETSGEPPPSTSYVSHPQVKQEEQLESGSATTTYGSYPPAYVPALYDVRKPFPYAPSSRVQLPLASHPPPTPHPSMSVHDYRPDPYAYEPTYAPRDFTLPPDVAHNVPINLSSDASLDLSTERTEWPRRKPPEPPPARLPLPGKKLILETYQSETRSSSPRSVHTETRAPPTEEFPRAEYLPKKMRAAEIMGGKLAAARHALPDAPASSAQAGAECSTRSDTIFLEDPKNVASRSKSTAAALARERQEAATPTRSVKAPMIKSECAKFRKFSNRAKESSPCDTDSPRPTNIATPDSCCGLDGINIKTGVICDEKHSEILNRERVISICNIDKHDLDDYLNEGNSQEHEEELLQYFHQRTADVDPAANTNPSEHTTTFLETGLDPHDDHSQGKNEKILQLRALLAKNLRNQGGSSAQNNGMDQKAPPSDISNKFVKSNSTDETFKIILDESARNVGNGQVLSEETNCYSANNQNGISLPFENPDNHILSEVGAPPLYNGECNTVPQSPTTRAQQYDFVPISDGCYSPGNIHSKSPLEFVQRDNSPIKLSKTLMTAGVSRERSLQTSPISHSTAASPFVSPRNTPVPRSRLCPRPIPKHNGRHKRNPLTLGMSDTCSKQFAIPNEQKFVNKTAVTCNTGIRYCQPVSAPPSPNILPPNYKTHMFLTGSNLPNGNNNLGLHFSQNTSFREHINGEIGHPLSADPLSNEVSQFFQEPLLNYRVQHDNAFRSQSVPLKQAMSMGVLSYNNTPAGSVPPTPVPNEFCDFGSLTDTCDISKAGLNPETLDKIYDAIDSSNEVLNSNATQNLLNSNGSGISNGCEQLPQQQILEDELTSLIQNENVLLSRTNHFSQPFINNNEGDDVEEFIKRTNRIEFNYTDLDNEKNKYYTSRSVPSTPLPFKRAESNCQLGSRNSRTIFSTNDGFANMCNNISSKSVPSTPQLAEERNVFNYSNRDFLINGNSLDICGTNQMHNSIVDNSQDLGSPLHDMLREEITEPLTPATDLLADLDKIDSTAYDDL